MDRVPVYDSLGSQESIGTFDIRDPLAVDKDRLMVLCPGIPARSADMLTPEGICWVEEDGNLHDVIDHVNASELVTPQIRD